MPKCQLIVAFGARLSPLIPLFPLIPLIRIVDSGSGVFVDTLRKDRSASNKYSTSIATPRCRRLVSGSLPTFCVCGTPHSSSPRRNDVHREVRVELSRLSPRRCVSSAAGSRGVWLSFCGMRVACGAPLARSSQCATRGSTVVISQGARSHLDVERANVQLRDLSMLALFG